MAIPGKRDSRYISQKSNCFSLFVTRPTRFEVELMKVRTILSRRLYKDKPRQQPILRLSYGGVAVLICSMMLLLNACTLFPGPSQGSKGDDSADNTSAYNTTSTQIASDRKSVV